jgi:hypothetical protein
MIGAASHMLRIESADGAKASGAARRPAKKRA